MESSTHYYEASDSEHVRIDLLHRAQERFANDYRLARDPIQKLYLGLVLRTIDARPELYPVHEIDHALDAANDLRWYRNGMNLRIATIVCNYTEVRSMLRFTRVDNWTPETLEFVREKVNSDQNINEDVKGDILRAIRNILDSEYREYTAPITRRGRQNCGRRRGSLHLSRYA